MPLAPVDDGAQLFYRDSGSTSSGRTLICLHGFSFNSISFQPIVAIAQQHDVRIITVNRRGYRHSTAISEEEWEVLERPDATVQDFSAFMAKRALEISRLLVYLVEQEKVAGEMTLLAWSLGNQSLLSFLANLDKVPKSDLDAIRKHLKAVILYDPPGHVFTADLPEQAYNPLVDESIPPNERQAAFGAWVSGHYAHPDPASPDPAMLEYRTPMPNRPTHLSTMTPEVVLEGLDPQASREQVLIWPAAKVGFWDVQTKAALVESAAVLPDLRICHVWCDESGWECCRSQHAIAKALAGQEGARKVDTRRISGANHFWHGEDPEAALDLFASI